MTTPQQLLSPSQTAVRLCVSPSTLAKWRVTGAGPTFTKVGARVFYDQSDLFDWLEQNKRSSTSSGSRGQNQ
ncbi:helix-turn-helix domain-containing protein [Maricaulis sp.]|uniref:helix-turn-helix transcriptional regulator n=1 Tax=Maricaulis sp. TaxID=1486257 RepID=UPI0034132418